MPEDKTTPTAFIPAAARTGWGTGGYFLALFLPIALLLGAIVGGIYHTEVRSRSAGARLQASHDVDTSREAIVRELHTVAADTIFLANQSALRNLLANGRAAAQSELERDYRVFCQTKPIYYQIRFLNTTGEEIVRVHRTDGQLDNALWDTLRNQSLENEFRQGIALARGQVLVTQLKVSQHSHETIRSIMSFGTPVFDAEDKKCGVLLLDFLANTLIQKVRDQMLLDQNGYWIHGGRPEDRWGFMVPGSAKFSDRWPAAWALIQARDNGQETLAEEGLFTYHTIYPMREVRLSLSGAAHTVDEGKKNPFCWKIVRHVSPQQLSASLSGLRAGLGWFYAVLVAIVGIAAMPYARLMARKQEVQEKLREYAITDSLTRIYNRGFGMEMLGRLINECRRLKTQLCVIMIDVNNLKKVNDHFGHKAGDALLTLVAVALRDSLREVDVVSRFGGDEFLVVLPFTPLENAEAILARVQQHITEMDTSQFDPYEVGFSFGGAEYDPEQNPSIRQLMDTADAKMYENKRKHKVGRD